MAGSRSQHELTVEIAGKIASSFGKITGSVIRIGLTIPENLFGGLEKYLQQNGGFIKDRIVSDFDEDFSKLIKNLIVTKTGTRVDIFCNEKMATKLFYGISQNPSLLYKDTC